MALADQADADPWLAACRRAAAALGEALAAAPTTAERAREVGRGEGGDMTVAVDEAAEAIVFAELETMHAAGERFTALSEERGEVAFGDPALRVVIDPIDGSLNAKRGLPPHCLSIALADGPTVGDVFFGFVHDFGTGEEWRARRGGGAWLDGTQLDAGLPERRDRAGRLELVAVESADPRWLAPAMDDLLAGVHRLRALGAIALSMCSVAAARVDGMVSLRRCRSFDAAAAALIVAEAGGCVCFPGADERLGAPLDLVPHYPVAAARTSAALATLAAIPSMT
jgi:myo-inositol-1(or 4)-monophosphatase